VWQVVHCRMPSSQNGPCDTASQRAKSNTLTTGC
jgi:hypothetical protein